MNTSYQESAVCFSTATDVYEQFERKSSTKYNRKCIDGSITGCGSCVGYCRFYGHPGFLTHKHREQHDCVNKRCFYYIPKPKAKHISDDKDFERSLLNLVQKSVAGMDDLKIINVQKKDQTWIIGYITVFGGHVLSATEDALQKNIGVPIAMQKLDYSFDRCVELLLK